MHKSRSEYRDGYKAHIAVEPETGLVTAAALTPANASDGRTGVTLLADEEPGLQVLADGAYGSGESLAALHEANHSPAVKPFPIHAAFPGAFHRDDFIVDHGAATVTCPAGQTVPITPKRRRGLQGTVSNLPLRSRCTNIKQGRQFHLTADDEALVESRRAWRDGDFARTTDGGDRWWSARSPGSWRTTTDGSASGASRGTSSVFRCASPPSISDGWSTSDWTTTESGGSGRADPGRASPGRQKWDLTSGTAHPGWPASTHFHAGASVRT